MSDSLSPVAAPAVASSLIAIVVVYLFVFGAGAFYLLRMMGKRAATPRLGLRDGPMRTLDRTTAARLRREAADSGAA